MTKLGEIVQRGVTPSGAIATKPVEAVSFSDNFDAEVDKLDFT